jgi:hypothetical protein
MKNKLENILTIVLIFSFILFYLNSNIRAEDNLPTAEEIIENYYAATGGKKAHEMIKNKKTIYKINHQASGMEIDYVHYQERPNKSYSLMDMGANGNIISGSDGKVAWEISPFTGTRVLEGDELATRLLRYTFDGHDAWNGLYKTVITEGIEDVNERTCYKVVYTPKQASPKIHYYDKETFLLLKTAWGTRNRAGVYSIEIFMEEYKKTGEILSAHKFTRYRMGQVNDIGVVKSIETNIEMPRVLFDLPEEIQKIVSRKTDPVSQIVN